MSQNVGIGYMESEAGIILQAESGGLVAQAWTEQLRNTNSAAELGPYYACGIWTDLKRLSVACLRVENE